MTWSKSKIITLSSIIIIAVGLLFLIHKLKSEINVLKAKQEKYALIEGNIDKFMSYKSLPIEKLNSLDFINKEIIEAGKYEMQKHKVVFAGISRDNAAELPMVIRNIEYFGQLFKDYKVIIFENDSSDGTKSILNLWAKFNPKVEIISQDFHNKKRPSIKFLADARNQYLNHLEKEQYEGFDLVMPIDMDMKYGIDPRGIQDSFSKIERWDMVCSNGISDAKGTMYDGFAFRSSKLPYSPQDKEDYWGDYMKNNVQIVYYPNSDLVPVHSCFGGLAIYKRKFLEGCKYDSIHEDCEHVVLHECMRSKHNARIFMNPAQVIRYSHYK